MNSTSKIIVLLISIVFLSSFSAFDKSEDELKQLLKFEKLALENNAIGKVYSYDLTKKKSCNVSEIKYLGIIKTKNGKQYKILNSFFVFTTGTDMCHGTSNIKIYNMKNQFVGKYYAGMPYGLPEKIIQNKFLCWTKAEDCNRKDYTINFGNGLPKSFFVPCLNGSGDEYSFSNE
ncbi:hypothetical protein [Flavobacterium sp. GCM10027622]|uniref:hypothetical protein n=1 Tax=unclassified Flavobacterium TaxID=196869 RepID=UPI003605C911